jgi:hypothetical protein
MHAGVVANLLGETFPHQIIISLSTLWIKPRKYTPSFLIKNFLTSQLHVLYCTYSVTLLGAGTRCGPPGTAILSASCPASPGAYSTSLSASSAMMPGSTTVTGWCQCSIGSVCFGPLGSGSIIICTDPDPSINKQRN